MKQRPDCNLLWAGLGLAAHLRQRVERGPYVLVKGGCTTRDNRSNGDLDQFPAPVAPLGRPGSAPSRDTPAAPPRSLNEATTEQPQARGLLGVSFFAAFTSIIGVGDN
jgi:hypothetical protein